MRVVSLTCSNTEIVCALGCASMLVGVDDHSDHPAEVVAHLPRVGPDLGIDVARVAALAPDLVLASLTVPGHERVVARIAAAGLLHIAPAPESLADVYRDILDIAARLGVEERGARLVREMQRAMPAVVAAVDLPESALLPPGVLVEWWPKPVIVPGRRSWVNDLLHAAGGRNPWERIDAASLTPSDAEVAARAPDAVVVSWCGIEPDKVRAERVYERVAWSALPALEQGRVYAVPEAFLGRPGPRLVAGYRHLRAIVAACQGDGSRASSLGLAPVAPPGNLR